MIAFDTPAVLWLLPLAVLPFIVRRGHALANTGSAMMPRDWPSVLLGRALQFAAVVALAAILIAMAGPHRPEFTVEKVGRGAEIVLVLDRSRSMDQNFAGARGAAPKGTGPEALEYYSNQRAYESKQSKGKVARDVLAEFTAKRPDDRFGMVAFSSLPMRVLDFTQKNEVIQAAISAGNIGRGLTDTNIGLALEAGLSFFDDRPYAGSRIIMLVSDGGDHIAPDVREQIAQLVRNHRVGIYWLYIRSARSPGLNPDAGDPAINADSVPEHVLHRFFESLGTPYRAYEAENPEALQKAIDDVNRLENLPITYRDTVPRRDLSAWGYGAALAGVLILLAAQAMEIKRWA